MSFDTINPYLHDSTERPILSDAITLRNQILDYMLLNNQDSGSKVAVPLHTLFAREPKTSFCSFTIDILDKKKTIQAWSLEPGETPQTFEETPIEQSLVETILKSCYWKEPTR